MKFFGKAKVKYNGKLADSKPGASCDRGGIKRTPVNTDNGMGYTEETVNSLVECELVLRAGDSLDELQNLTDGTIVFECDTGQRYIIKDAFCTDPPKITGGQGVNISFAGKPAEELVS